MGVAGVVGVIGVMDVRILMMAIENNQGIVKRDRLNNMEGRRMTNHTEKMTKTLMQPIDFGLREPRQRMYFV